MGSNVRADLMVSAWQKFCRGFLHAQYLGVDIAVFDAERSGTDNLWVTAKYLPDRSEFEVRVDRVRVSGPR